jgi:hypothetical protein
MVWFSFAYGIMGAWGKTNFRWFSPCSSASASQASQSPGGPRACVASGHRSVRMSSPLCTGDTAPSASAHYELYLRAS